MEYFYTIKRFGPLIVLEPIENIVNIESLNSDVPNPDNYVYAQVINNTVRQVFTEAEILVAEERI